MNEDDQHEWQFRLVWREGGRWHAMEPEDEHESALVHFHHCATELIIQRRRKRDLYDPTPCEGIEHPVWRDWEASPDAEIQAVLVRKGMPFRSLEK
jgi:hypothetical protein